MAKEDVLGETAEGSHQADSSPIMSSMNDCVNVSNSCGIDIRVSLSAYPPWLVIFLWLLTVVFSVETILGNLLVLLAYKLERNIRRQLSNKFIVSLAITDLIIGMEGFPLLTVYVVGRERWPLGHLLCQFWLFLDYTLCLVSILNVLLITIDRYGSVCYPAQYRIWQSRSKVRVFIFISWVVPCVLFGMMIFAWEHMTGQGMDDSGKCYAPFLNDPYVNMAMYIIYYWTTLVAMSVLYRGIHTAAKALEDKSKARERQTIALLLGQRCMAQVGVGMLLHSSASDEEEENAESFFHPRSTVDYGYATGTTEFQHDNPSIVATVSVSDMNAGYEELRDDEVMTATSDSDEKTPLNVPRIVAPPTPKVRRVFNEYGKEEEEEGEDVSVSLLPLIDRSESKISGISGTDEFSPSSSAIFTNRPAKPGHSEGRSRGNGHRRRVLTPVNSYGGMTVTRDRTLCGSVSLDEGKINWDKRPMKQRASKETLASGRTTRRSKNSLFHDSSCSLEYYGSEKASVASLYDDTSLNSVFEFGNREAMNDCDKSASTECSMDSSMISMLKWRRNGDVLNVEPNSSCTTSSLHSTTSSKQCGSPMRSKLSTKSEIHKRSPRDHLSIPGVVAPSSSSPAGLVHLTSTGSQNVPSARPSVQITISGDTDQLTPIIEEDNKSTTTTVHSPSNAAVAAVLFAQRPSSAASSSSVPKKGKKGRDDHEINHHLTVPNSSQRSKLGFIGRRKQSVMGKKTKKKECRRESWQSNESSIYNDKNRRLTGLSNIDDDEDSCGSGQTSRGVINAEKTEGKTKDGKSNGWLMTLFNNPASILNRKRKVTKAERRARKAFRTITVIVGTFALFWSPYYIVATLYGFCPDCVPPPLFLTSYYLCYLNSSVNPFAYAFANRLFRKTFIRILRGDLRRT